MFASSLDDYHDLTWEYSEIIKKKILIEGDSWTHIPYLDNLRQQIEMEDRYNAICNLSFSGHRAVDMFINPKQFSTLERAIKTEQFGYKWDLIFISAGGNDIVGPEISENNYEFVNKKSDHPDLYGAELISDEFRGVVDSVVEMYRRFLNMVQSTELNRGTPVVTHSYSYLQPRKVGINFLGKVWMEGWISRYLDDPNIGVTDSTEQANVVKGFLDYFYDSMKPLENEFDNFFIADTRQCLSDADNLPIVELWNDEIHATDEGYRRVFKEIKEQATAAGKWF